MTPIEEVLAAGPGLVSSAHTKRVSDYCFRSKGSWDHTHDKPISPLGLCGPCLEELRETP